MHYRQLLTPIASAHAQSAGRAAAAVNQSLVLRNGLVGTYGVEFGQGGDDPWQRTVYENECLLSGGSVRQRQRQIDALLYERTGLSKNKRAVVARARRQAADAPATIEDLRNSSFRITPSPSRATDRLPGSTENASPPHPTRDALRAAAAPAHGATGVRRTLNATSGAAPGTAPALPTRSAAGRSGRARKRPA